MTILTEVAVSAEALGNIWSQICGLSLMGVLKIIVLVIVLLVIIRALNGMFAKVLEKSKVEKTAHGFLRTLVKILLYFVAVMVIAGSMGINISSLIAVLSVAGLALTLAVQGALSNLAGGIVILFTKPFRVGDYVSIGAHEGNVKEINMTYTMLTTLDHLTISIPNSTVTGSNVVNYSVEGRRRVDFQVCASYECTVDAAKEALAEAILAVPQLAKTEEVFTRISGYKDNGVEYTIRAWCDNADYWDAYFGLIESIKRTFDAKGVAMSYPNVNVYVKKD